MTLVFGIVNVTPDSFSDGGQFFATDKAIAHGKTLLAQGAQVLDIGGESTRPGAVRPSEAEELDRVIPVVEELAKLGTVSVDTMRAEVAKQSVQAGASIINDVSGGLADPQMLSVVAELGVNYICQHWRGHGSVMNQLAEYQDVVQEVKTELLQRVAAATSAGIKPENIVLDPGLGFAKQAHMDWQILANIQVYNQLGYRVLIGASRKRFLADLLPERSKTELDAATAAVSALAAANQVWAVRTHEVRAQRDVIDVVEKVLSVKSTDQPLGES